MAIASNVPAPETPTKKRKVQRPPKPWATCAKSSFQEWRKDDYFVEFNMGDADWEVLDAQVMSAIVHTLIADEKATR